MSAERGRGGWQVGFALLLVGLLGLPGCQSSGTATALGAETSLRVLTSHGPVVHRGASPRGSGAAPALLPVCCDFGVDRGSVAVLVGVAIILAPIWIPLAILGAPFIILGGAL